MTQYVASSGELKLATFGKNDYPYKFTSFVGWHYCGEVMGAQLLPAWNAFNFVCDLDNIFKGNSHKKYKYNSLKNLCGIT